MPSVISYKGQTNPEILRKALLSRFAVTVTDHGTPLAIPCSGNEQRTINSGEAMKKRLSKLSRSFLSASVATAALSLSVISQAADTIKVGVLHSLSGTMAISETTLKDTVLMMVEEQNKKGGVLGKQLEAVVVDPASDWPLFAEKARELLVKKDVDVIFGGWTSVSRKSVLPVKRLQ